ncbi:synaptic vesicle glycoprotein 2B-like isoform X2 [Bacillus rossius redtenbacheri]|uniref:synaptic vesicle glycoprotein 2B-like isoform X2 n=1 Tax=Bacillus rossius redtenbacheri TaxID=93214 RepID=UPI002FDD3108
MTKYFIRDNTGRINGKPVDFEDAVILAGYGKFQRRLLFISGLCLMAVTIELMNIGYVLPAAHCDLELTSVNKGIINAVIFVGMMVSSHAWGLLADTRGRKYIIILALLLNYLCTIASSFSFSIWMLLVLRFLNGVFICCPAAVMYAYLGEFHSGVTQTRAIVSAHAFTSLGAVVLPGLAWLVIPQPWSYQTSHYTYSSWRLFQLMCVVPGLVSAALVLFRLPESPRFLLARGRPRDALRVLQRVFTDNSGCRADQYPVTALLPDPQRSICRSTGDGSKPMFVRYMWNQTWPLFVSPHLTNIMLLSLLQFGLFVCESGLLWMPGLFSQLAQFSSRNPEAWYATCDMVQQMRDTSNETGISQAVLTCSSTLADDVYRYTLIMAGAATVACILAVRIIDLLGKKLVLWHVAGGRWEILCPVARDEVKTRMVVSQLMTS